ncbi:MAG: Asp-tRNA(Asn)/Glu-tRNA(Gln) amidotransferase subunit GatC [Candidatus Sericytochromatia bacterium]|nr:Asp-tRNA(Asn)/Glu-tRNA(Gln) amidotransferase subunit GatC [Candidatus Sericytochromatia bacterium]
MISRDDVVHIAKLARLTLSEAELDSQTEQLGRIVDFFNALDRVDTAGVALTSHPLPVENAARPDVRGASLELDALLAGAPQREGDYFRVPRILDNA